VEQLSPNALSAANEVHTYKHLATAKIPLHRKFEKAEMTFEARWSCYKALLFLPIAHADGFGYKATTHGKCVIFSSSCYIDIKRWATNG